MSLLVRIENDNLLTVDGVNDITDGTFINNADVTAILQDAAGANVIGQGFPLVLVYVTGSDGKYQGILEDTLALLVQTQYTLVISINVDFGSVATFRIPVNAIIRGAC